MPRRFRLLNRWCVCHHRVVLVHVGVITVSSGHIVRLLFLVTTVLNVHKPAAEWGLEQPEELGPDLVAQDARLGVSAGQQVLVLLELLIEDTALAE